MGDGYGPMLITKTGTELPDLNDEVAVRTWLREKRIAVPGKMTSAFLSLGLYMGGFPDNCVVVPFDEIFDSVSKGDTDVGLIIHEGQLTYARV
jgi:1,4-dihydroxy-6-naphthoate synthase